MKKTGFTMLELMVVVIIVGIIAAFALPSMRVPLERSRGRNAEFNLQAIYAAQKRFLLGERHYYICDQAATPNDRVYALNQNLSIKIDDQYFEYNIIGGARSYRAVATRKKDAGMCGNKNMSLTEDNSTVKKGCSAW